MEVQKSVWAEMTILKWVFFWLIVPIIVACVVAKSYRVEITDKKITVCSGVFNKQETSYAIAGITEMSLSKTFFGGIFNYGNIRIDLAGQRTVYLNGILSPDDVKRYLSAQISKVASAKHVVVN